MTTPDASRPHRRAVWADVRFLLGIVLVVASVVGVWLVVAAARQTVPVFAATRTIVAGEAVEADALRVVEVALGSMEETYASPGVLAADAVATRTIGAGELVPRSSLGDAGASTLTTVVVRSATDVPAAVETGTVVEVWAAPQLERGEYDEPRILIPDATVSTVTRDDSMVGTASAALELVIARADVAAALGAVADGAALSVVPSAGTSR